MTLEVKPLAGKVFIVPDPVKPKTFLHVPESAMNRDMPSEGTVFAIGGRRITKKGVVIDHDFKVGDHVIFRRFSGLWVNIRGHKLIQVGMNDVEAIVQDEVDWDKFEKDCMSARTMLR